MGNFVFNIAKGKVAELAARVNANDPTEASLLVILVASTGVESDATLIDSTDLADVFGGTTNEATNTGAARKVLDQTAGITITPVYASDYVDVDIPDQTWTAVANDGTGAISDLIIAYRPTNASADSACVPLSMHDFAVTPDGSDITAQIATGGFYRAS